MHDCIIALHIPLKTYQQNLPSSERYDNGEYDGTPSGVSLVITFMLFSTSVIASARRRYNLSSCSIPNMIGGGQDSDVDISLEAFSARARVGYLHRYSPGYHLFASLLPSCFRETVLIMGLTIRD